MLLRLSTFCTLSKVIVFDFLLKIPESSVILSLSIRKEIFEMLKSKYVPMGTPSNANKIHKNINHAPELKRSTGKDIRKRITINFSNAYHLTLDGNFIEALRGITIFY